MTALPYDGSLRSIRVPLPTAGAAPRADGLRCRVRLAADPFDGGMQT
jgi:hypothetical protein